MQKITVPKRLSLSNMPLGLLLIMMAALLIISMGIAIGVGSVPISQSTVWGVIAHKLSFSHTLPNWSIGRENIVWAVRFPRTI